MPQKGNASPGSQSGMAMVLAVGVSLVLLVLIAALLNNALPLAQADPLLQEDLYQQANSFLGRLEADLTDPTGQADAQSLQTCLNGLISAAAEGGSAVFYDETHALEVALQWQPATGQAPGQTLVEWADADGLAAQCAALEEAFLPDQRVTVTVTARSGGLEGSASRGFVHSARSEVRYTLNGVAGYRRSGTCFLLDDVEVYPDTGDLLYACRPQELPPLEQRYEREGAP